ncbi:MAG: UDP-N-acetylmuramoyl-tripeptide--D-alanyl-D-alanine ligase [Candidatus Rokubacteria bacterium]|nr:UDP-N-acetylmuramoyl-tripeptide--D-alanyl-D-alanine ligase [Candidatus Rokubacteria bacterium]
MPDDVPAGVPLVMVEDTTKALGSLAAWHRARFDVPVVAVTGSNGKTTTKEMIAGVLGTRWRTHRPRSSFNNQWGLPLTLFALGPEHDALVVEIGANQPGEIAYLAGLARPTVSVVTTVAAVHTEFFRTLDGVRDEKAALVRALASDGFAVLNADDPRVASMARDTSATVVTYGRAPSARVRATDERDEPGGVSFTLHADGGRAPAALAFAGRHNVGNALAAAGVGVALGFSLEEIASGLAAARPVAGRCVWKAAADVRILDDTYNANPVSVAAALDTVAAHRGDSRLILVLGDMLELGDIADEAHRELGRRVAAMGAAHFIGVGRHAALAVEAARAAGFADARQATTFEDTMAELLKQVAPGDVVLVKGSRGMRMERVVDALVARLQRPQPGTGPE